MTRTSSRLAGHAVGRGDLALLGTLALGVFAGAFDLGVLSPALHAIAAGFRIGPRDASWVFTLYLFANVVSIPIAAKCADRYGRRAAYLWCVGIFAAGSLLAIAAPSFGVFLIARAVQAAGAGGIFPVATAAIADVVPAERRGSALGILGAVWGLAAILGPNAGGAVVHFVSWHWIFAANLPLAIAVIALGRRYVPATAPRRRGALDVAGLFWLSLALLGVMVALTMLDARNDYAITGAASVVAIIASVAFVANERRAAEPVIPPAMFAGRQLRVTYGLELLIGALEGALFFIPAALVAGERLDYAAAGGIAALGAVAFVVTIPPAGRALDRFGSRAVLASGSLCTAAGLGLVAAFLRNLPLSAAGIVVAGIGFGALLGAPTRYIVTNETPAQSRASAVGLLSIVLIVGQIAGGSLAGGVLGSRLDDPAAYQRAYAIFAAIALLVAAGTLLLADRARERRAAGGAHALR